MGALLAPLEPYLAYIKAALVALVLAAAFGAGWTVRDWKADAEQAVVLRAHAEAVRQQLAKNRAVHSEIAAQLAEERAGREQDLQDFERRLRNAKPTRLVTVDCTTPAPADKPVTRLVDTSTAPTARPATDAPPETSARGDDAGPRVLFTGEFIGLWNDALSIGLPEAYRAGRPEAALERAGVAHPRDDILTNLAQNAARLNECGSRLTGWQRWACKHGFMEGAACSNL